jgi:hypothetical protein
VLRLPGPLVAALLALPASAAPAAPSPESAVAALVSLTPPKGWEKTAYANAGGADAVVAYQDGADRLLARVFGAPGSFYETPRAFLTGPAAATMGRRPRPAGRALVAGRRLRVYRRGYPLADGDPHAVSSGRARMASERFVILPPAPDGRFVVLSYQRESPVPDPELRGEAAWKAFLKSARRKVPRP